MDKAVVHITGIVKYCP